MFQTVVTIVLGGELMEINVKGDVNNMSIIVTIIIIILIIGFAITSTNEETSKNNTNEINQK